MKNTVELDQDNKSLYRNLTKINKSINIERELKKKLRLYRKIH